MSHVWIVVGAIAGFLGVAMGAFGAHALSGSLSERSIAIYETAAQYQMYHALALIGVGLWCAFNPTAVGLANASGWAFSLGILIFSGSLYALALTDIRILGAITPIGGLAFLAGWVLFALSAWKIS